MHWHMHAVCNTAGGGGHASATSARRACPHVPWRSPHGSVRRSTEMQAGRSIDAPLAHVSRGATPRAGLRPRAKALRAAFGRPRGLRPPPKDKESHCGVEQVTTRRRCRRTQQGSTRCWYTACTMPCPLHLVCIHRCMHTPSVAVVQLHTLLLC